VEAQNALASCLNRSRFTGGFSSQVQLEQVDWNVQNFQKSLFAGRAGRRWRNVWSHPDAHTSWSFAHITSMPPMLHRRPKPKPH